MTAPGWPDDAVALEALQDRLAAQRPPPWRPAGEPLVAAVAAADGGAGLVAAAVLARGPRVLAGTTVTGPAPGPYAPSLLALREGPLLAAAVAALGRRPDVLLVAAAGRDHPRRAGLALHLGAALDLPSAGVTDRPLVAVGPEPGPARGDTAPLLAVGEEVARAVRTAPGVRPVVASAGWRTDPATAAALVLSTTAGVRLPEPLRAARRRAREAR
ncbi:endonuclease V [Geodermatophilus saharensis]|uniref:endonuclease V n=1 Tax=Geodermatophilus saharensis TaxID=1137994 RepID=UPI000B78C203|nr:endonuclease V [Geodermatophilus saharensis]